MAIYAFRHVEKYLRLVEARRVRRTADGMLRQPIGDQIFERGDYNFRPALDHEPNEPEPVGEPVEERPAYLFDGISREG
ncbi:MAG: hypothetical protein ACK4ZY_00025 [Sphingomonas sp.]